MLLSKISSIFNLYSSLIVVSIGLLIQFPGYHGSATFWPSGYYGYNRDYDNLRITSSTGFRSPLDQSTWVLPPSQTASSRYVVQPSPTNAYGASSSSNYYGTSFPYSYYSYMSGLPSSTSTGNYYSASSYPYNEWWKFYSQYPTRSSYSSSSWPTSSYPPTANGAYNNYANALAIHCKYASFYRPGHPTYPYYPHSSSTSPTGSSNSPYYPIYSYGSTNYPFTYNGYRSPTSYYPQSYGANYPQSSLSSDFGLGGYGYGSMSPPSLPLPSSIGLPPVSRDLWSQPPTGFGDVDFNRRMGWLGTVPNPANTYTPNYHHMNHLFGNNFPSVQSQPPIKSARAVAEITGPSGVTGTIVFKQIGSRPVAIEGKIMGLTPGPHGLHVYEMPLLGGDCLSAGGHYNPQKTEHGGKHDWNRHIGDLGNIFADINGVASFDLTDLLISLTGGYSIVNRTIAISEKADDLGRGSDVQSKRDGNSGPPIACGIIRLSII